MSFIHLVMTMFDTTYFVVILAMTTLMGFNGAQRTDDLHSCKGEDFNPQTQLCCGGQVEAQPMHGTRACCGGTESGRFYFHEQKICCGNTLRDITPDLKCCNSQLFYNDTTQTCCGAEVIDLSEGKVCCPGPNYGLQGFPGFGGNHKCCGTSGPYRPEAELCCEVGEESIIRERPNGGQVECCGLDTMDTSTHMCCGKEKIPREPLLECCGRGTYNVTTEICCRGRAVPKGSNGGYKCCGHQSYNPQNEVCCFGEVRGIGHGKCCTAERQTFTAYQPGSQSCCNSKISAIPEISGIQQCCNKEAYLTSSQMCCGGNLFDREEDLECCGSSTYNRGTHLCCNNDILLKRRPTDQCCASERFNPSRQTCCGGQVLPQVGKCCRLSWNTYEIYNEQTQTCCGIMDWNNAIYVGHVYNVAASPATCCGSHLLASDQLCDHDVPRDKGDSSHNEVCRYKNNDEWMYVTFNKEEKYCNIFTGVTAIFPGHKLCGYGTYNPETHLCCSDYVKRKTGPDTSCCGIQSYDKTRQSCLLGKVFDEIPEEFAGYCRDEAFDNRTYTCDVNFEIRPIGDPERCGTEPFNTEERECCNGELIGPGFTCCDGVRTWETPGTNLGEGQCCFDPRFGSSRGYNSLTHICCQGEVHEVIGQAGIECCGRDAYDPTDSSSICCGHRRYATADGKTECTGSTPHRPDQIVCDGVVHLAFPGGTCCGKSLINEENHVCCDGHLYNKESQDTQCCGKKSYNPSVQTCCGASLHESQDTDGLCCGDLFYNSRDHVCHQSGGEHYLFRSEDEGMLCSEGSYDSNNHTCCQGILHKHIAHGECCGNEVVRDTDKQMCCGGKLKQREGGLTECCGVHMFNPDRHQCCGRKVMPRYSVYRQCCNDRIIPAVDECISN